MIPRERSGHETECVCARTRGARACVHVCARARSLSNQCLSHSLAQTFGCSFTSISSNRRHNRHISHVNSGSRVARFNRPGACACVCVPPQSSSDDAKKVMRREKNRIAAQKSRMRQTQKADSLHLVRRGHPRGDMGSGLQILCFRGGGDRGWDVTKRYLAMWRLCHGFCQAAGLGATLRVFRRLRNKLARVGFFFFFLSSIHHRRVNYLPPRPEPKVLRPLPHPRFCELY